MPRAVPARLPSLTGLRFFLAFSVLLTHATYVLAVFGGPLQQAHGFVELAATAAVSGFFILSGFVLAWTSTPDDHATAFWRRRFWKIFPNHTLAWALTVGFVAVAIAISAPTTLPGHSVLAGITGLFLLQDWIPDVNVFAGFNSPAWSVSCEVFFYALFPLLVAGARRIPANRLRHAWVALAVVVLTLPVASMAIRGPAAPAPYDWLRMNEYSLWFVYVLPPVRLMEFALGIITARLVQRAGWPRLPRWLSVSLVAVSFLMTPFLPPQYLFGAACAIPLALVIGGLARHDIAGRSSLLTRPLVVALGDASYALYMIHFPVLLITWTLCADLIRSPWAATLFTVGFMVTAQALAVLVYRRYERPLMRRFARPRRPGDSSSAVTEVDSRNRPDRSRR
jgi:peptidoglycan/LPS O-acetylase OafA/YrhL